MLVLGRVNIGTKADQLPKPLMTRSMPHPLRSFPQCLQVGDGIGEQKESRVSEDFFWLLGITQDVSTSPFKGKNALKSQHVFFSWVKVGWIPSQPIPATGNCSQTDVNIGDVNPPKGKT